MKAMMRRTEERQQLAMRVLARRMRAGRVALLTGTMILAAAGSLARGKTLTWKPVEQALLKENNHPVKTWNVYQAEKNHNLVLVQVDRNWFLFNLKEKRVYRVQSSDFQTHGDSLTGPEPDRQTQVAKTDGWDSHDVGPAQQITVRITATGNVLAIELPHPLAVY